MKNPEGYTGYRGAHIWKAIFKENCFSESYSNLCVEDKIFSNIFMGWLVNTNFQIGCNFRNRETNYTYINISYVTTLSLKVVFNDLCNIKKWPNFLFKL